MEAKYTKTGLVTDDGQDIYHRIRGKGRPALFVLSGTEYIHYKRPLKKVVKQAAVEVPAETPVANG